MLPLDHRQQLPPELIHVMTIVRGAPSIITPATPHHPPPASA